jgi:hypothetical protein
MMGQARHQLQRKARGYFEHEPKHCTWWARYEASCKGKHEVTLNMNQNTLYDGPGTTPAAKGSTRLLWTWIKTLYMMGQVRHQLQRKARGYFELEPKHCMMELVFRGWRRGKWLQTLQTALSEGECTAKVSTELSHFGSWKFRGTQFPLPFEKRGRLFISNPNVDPATFKHHRLGYYMLYRLYILLYSFQITAHIRQKVTIYIVSWNGSANTIQSLLYFNP